MGPNPKGHAKRGSISSNSTARPGHIFNISHWLALWQKSQKWHIFNWSPQFGKALDGFPVAILKCWRAYQIQLCALRAKWHLLSLVHNSMHERNLRMACCDDQQKQRSPFQAEHFSRKSQAFRTLTCTCPKHLRPRPGPSDNLTQESADANGHFSLSFSASENCWRTKKTWLWHKWHKQTWLALLIIYPQSSAGRAFKELLAVGVNFLLPGWAWTCRATLIANSNFMATVSYPWWTKSNQNRTNHLVWLKTL